MVQWSSTIHDSGKTTIKLKRTTGKDGGGVRISSRRWMTRGGNCATSDIEKLWLGVEMRSRADRIVKKNNVNSRTNLPREWKRISCVETKCGEWKRIIRLRLRIIITLSRIKRLWNDITAATQRGTQPGMKVLVHFTGNSLEYTKILILRIRVSFSTNILLTK